MTKQDFIVAIANDAKTVCKELGYDYAQFATCCAQACCESAYGQSSLMSKANAYFGIKADKNWIAAGKKFFRSSTKECYNGKDYVSIVDGFRAYDSRLDSVRDYFILLNNKRYRASLTAKTVEECITLIKAGGYATSPSYVNTIINFYNNIKNTIDNVWNGTYTDSRTNVRHDTISQKTSAGKSQLVKEVQTYLNKFGYGLKIDGIWGGLTQGAVLDFQRSHKLAVDGWVGPLTWAKLEKGA